MWKNIVQPDRPQMTWHMHTALWVNKGYRHTLRICYNYCFSTATMVARMHLNVMLYINCLFCYCLMNIHSTLQKSLKLAICFYTDNHTI